MQTLAAKEFMFIRLQIDFDGQSFKSSNTLERWQMSAESSQMLTAHHGIFITVSVSVTVQSKKLRRECPLQPQVV